MFKVPTNFFFLILIFYNKNEKLVKNANFTKIIGKKNF